MKLQVGILLFDQVEVLDFAGPFEVFSLATSLEDIKLFEVNTISQTGRIVQAKNGLEILPARAFGDDKHFDILIIPGGYGAEEIEIKNSEVLSWIKMQKKRVNILASVCTGALLLAECGLLDNKKATTHWMDINRLQNEYPKIKVIRGVKFVDEEDIITSGGISAGINMSFHIIKRLFGEDIAKLTAKRMEYDIII
ncbi:MAG TPA: DJ-1/PfpI family protein [Flavobacterium sp.]|nr:DJ-1/PfpI family protein [Flavobacterium sp.]